MAERTVMSAAVKQREVRVVAQGLALRDRGARRADAALRQAVADWMLSA